MLKAILELLYVFWGDDMIERFRRFAAGISISICLLFSAPVSAAFLSSFETDAGLANGQWKVVSPSYEGWVVTEGPGIEIQNGNIGGTPAYSGVQKIELDSHGEGDTNSAMTRTVDLEAGTYEFSFAYFGRTEDEGTNGIGYSLSPDVLGIGNVTGVKSDGWQIFKETFTLDSAAEVNINFWASGDDDTFGGYLDDVRITAVPLPPAMLLFGAALVGLGWLTRCFKNPFSRS